MTNQRRSPSMMEQRLGHVETEVSALRADMKNIDAGMGRIEKQILDAQARARPNYSVLIGVISLVFLFIGTFGGFVWANITRDMTRIEDRVTTSTESQRNHELKGGHAVVEAEVSRMQAEIADLKVEVLEHVRIEGHPGTLRRIQDIENRVLRVEDFASVQTHRSLTSNTSQEERIQVQAALIADLQAELREFRKELVRMNTHGTDARDGISRLRGSD